MWNHEIMTIAIHYSAVRQAPKPGQIYGLQVAVLDWLRAYMRLARQEKLYFLVTNEAAQKEIRAIAEETGVEATRLAILDGRLPRENLSGFEAVFRADSDPHDLFWQRAYAGASFAFCGLAHAVTGLEAARAFEQYILAPTSAADAVICPSRAVAAAIARYWDHSAAFYERKFGRLQPCAAQLPVIPLGVDTARIEARVGPEKRKKQREKLGIGDKDIVLLWVGRLSYAIKAHPLPMFRAAELAARRTGSKIHFVMQGYFVPQEAEAEFAALARDVCPSVDVRFIAADDKRFPEGLWAAGDIFLSLIDNMQESFGLTPIEAIAAGLPRVVTDWDGYRDAVTDGEDGFLIPTIQPPAGAGLDYAAALLGERESYGGYLALVAQSTAVDAEAAAQALSRLIEDSALRARLAEKAKERLPSYDWTRIIPAYEDLWASLKKTKPAARPAAQPPQIVHPHAPDPYFIFESYPSAVLSPETRVGLALEPHEIRQLFAHKMNTLAAPFMIESKDIPVFLGAVAQKNVLSLRELFELFPATPEAALWRTAGWLLKLGILKTL